ncbi:MAG: hypothetical protein OXG85_00710 [Chloroflexi bacterium]|nr:hypothetical protein [Chloroflexota bacterium]
MLNQTLRRLRNHIHCLVIVPLVIIVMTWPTFPRLFDGDELWLHTSQIDKWQPIWDAKHIERVLAGKSDLYYTDYMFHPQGYSLAFYLINVPHALLSAALGKLMPADNANNLLYLAMLCFNAFSAYALLQHLIKDKWIALFGAVYVGIGIPYTNGMTLPVIIMIGTLPLTLYFLRRAVIEGRWQFAALAGFCAGFTAFISLYIFAVILLTLAIYSVFLAGPRWEQRSFWLQLLLVVGVCGAIAAFRIYPIVADDALRAEGLGFYQERVPSRDLLDFFVLTRNPITGDALSALFNVPPDALHRDAYLGYINLFFLCCALLHKPLRRRLAPWLALLLAFAILRLGDFLTLNSVAYTDATLPGRVLKDWFPSVFGAIGSPEYYQFGAVIPLAALSCFGLAALLRSKSKTARRIILLAAMLIAAMEFYVPRPGITVEPEKLAYMEWLESEESELEENETLKVINLPNHIKGSTQYFFLFQALTDYPQAYGFVNRTIETAQSNIDRNLLLRAWADSRSIHCLPHNRTPFLSAVEQLEAEGFTHIVEHDWFYGDRFIDDSFWNVPASYDNGFVKVYRLPAMRLSCESINVDIPHIERFLQSSWLVPGAGASILSFDAGESIPPHIFEYLSSLFSDWASFVHAYGANGDAEIQSVADDAADLAQFARDTQIIYLLYEALDAAPTALGDRLALEPYKLCQRQVHDDGSVMERYVIRDFACALFDASAPFQVEYDNGARLENLFYEFGEDYLNVQLWWSVLPSDPHSVSLQVFDAAGVKVASQDATIGIASLARQRLDVSALPPGEYRVKLIVYNFETGRSVPGALSLESTRFERELEIATIDRT